MILFYRLWGIWDNLTVYLYELYLYWLTIRRLSKEYDNLTDFQQDVRGDYAFDKKRLMAIQRMTYKDYLITRIKELKE